MDKKAVLFEVVVDFKTALFEAVVDFAVSFIFAMAAFWVTQVDPTVRLTLWIAGIYTGFGMMMDLVRRKGKFRILACGLTTFLGTIAGAATFILLK